MAESRYTCRQCGTWTCSVPLCGGNRPSTDIRYVRYPCPRCRGREGVLVPTMHTARMWRAHNEGDLPEPYAYGTRPEPGNWPEGFGPRPVPPILYRGVPLPDEFVANSAFMRGVDAALLVQSTRFEKVIALLHELNKLELEKDRDGSAEQPWWYMRDGEEGFTGVLGITFADELPEEDEDDD